MASEISQASFPNGTAPSQASSHDSSSLADFYERLSRLQEEVVSGKHPRIRLPAAALEYFAARGLLLSSNTKPAINGTTLPDTRNRVNPTSHELPSKPVSSSAPSMPSTNAQRPLPVKPSSSTINPILLTKSDDLVRAEMQLKRQRIERELKDQYDAKKGQGRDKDFVLDLESRLDVSEILAKALELVKPISGLTTSTNRNSSASDSFDENSYYSSQDNSFTTGEIDEDAIHQATGAAELDEQEDSDYSPPPADNASGQELPELTGRHRHLHPPVIVDNGDYSPPGSHVPVITNHITSPLAPQPSRVSPLAVARTEKAPDRVRNHGPSQQLQRKASPSRQHKPHQNNGAGSSGSRRNSPKFQQSPGGNRQNVQNPKKRRRENEASEKRRDKGKRVARSPEVHSPEPYIKPEPVSPPPFSFVQEQPRTRQPAVPLTDEIEVLSPRDIRSRPIYYREADPRQMQRAYEMEEPLTPTLIRVPSRGGYRVVHRDDQDLRRVASLQYARRPYSPQPIVYQDSRGVRSASQAYIDPPQSQAVYRPGSIRPDHLRARSRSPPVYLDSNYGGNRLPLAMAPPPAPTPVFVDEHGNKYYAAPPQEAPSALPRVRRAEGESVYEQPVSRAPPRESMAYEDEDIRPPPPARRHVESDNEYVDQNHYRTDRSYSMRPSEVRSPREVTYAAPAERRPTTIIYEDRPPPPPRDFGGRAYSVRPEMVRREVLPAEYMARHESVQPGYIRRAEPLPLPLSQHQQQPVYMAEPPQRRRYLEGEDSVPQRSVRRVSEYRY